MSFQQVKTVQFKIDGGITSSASKQNIHQDDVGLENIPCHLLLFITICIHSAANLNKHLDCFHL